MKTQTELKKEVALAACQQLTPGMLLGIGTGSTIDLFIEAMAEMGVLPRAAVSSSERSTERLRALGVEVWPLDRLEAPLDLYIDGADEVDPQACLIKGGGAALTREKIVASASRRFLCLVDASKEVSVLGSFALPVEFLAIAQRPVFWALQALGGEPRLREGVITDNGNPVVDVHGLRIAQPADLEDRINAIPGVVENGIFARHRADEVLVATPSGVLRRHRPATS